MSWLKRIFGQDKPGNVHQAISGQPAPANPTTATSLSASIAGGKVDSATSQSVASTGASKAGSIPPERVGFNGEYDQSGLAKRVALAFDEDPDLDDIETLFVAQIGSVVVLKGKAPNQEILAKMVNVAHSINGATAVETDQVIIA